MYKRISHAAVLASAFLMFNLPVMAAGGKLAATAAILGLSSEVSGPLAYGVSIIMIVIAALLAAANHHEMTAGIKGICAVLLCAGLAIGAIGVLGFVPGASGALI